MISDGASKLNGRRTVRLAITAVLFDEEPVGIARWRLVSVGLKRGLFRSAKRSRRIGLSRVKRSLRGALNAPSPQRPRDARHRAKQHRGWMQTNVRSGAWRRRVRI